MKLAVVGGTGVLGRAVVEQALGRGDEVRIISRSTPAVGTSSGVEHWAMDLSQPGEATSARLVAALEGVEAVIEAANSTRAARQVLIEGGKALLAAEAVAGVGHHVQISIIGCDRVPYSYYRVKAEQEQMVAAGPVPWSLIRASQFHNLLDGAFAAASKLRIRPVAAALVQPVEVSVVAARMVDAAHSGPAGVLQEVAGPEILTVGRLSAIWRDARGRHLFPVPVPMVGRMGRELKAGALCNEAAAAGGPGFAEWLADH